MQTRLDQNYFLFGVDIFLSDSLLPRFNFENEADIQAAERAISGCNKSLSIVAASIDHLIIDHVMQYPRWLHEVAYSLKGFDTFFVGIKAPLSVIQTSESTHKKCYQKSVGNLEGWTRCVTIKYILLAASFHHPAPEDLAEVEESIKYLTAIRLFRERGFFSLRQARESESQRVSKRVASIKI